MSICCAQSNDQSKRYNALGSQCRQLLPGSDLIAFARSLTPLPTTPHPSQRTRSYCPPQAPADTEGMILEPGVTVSRLSSSVLIWRCKRDEILMLRVYFCFLSGGHSAAGAKKRIGRRQAGQLGRESGIWHYKSGINGPRVSDETDTRFGGDV